MLVSLLGLLALSAANAPAPARGKFVSMGSSYAAGPGVGAPDAADAVCQRSSSNYAHLVANRRRVTLVDVACGGAVTDNILVRGQHGLPPQVSAVTADTTIVSILIGGNDVGYVANLIGLSCQDAGGVDCHILGDAEVDRRFAALPAALDRVVEAVRRRAPSAKVVLVAYLPAVPADAARRCAAVPLSPADGARMRRVAKRLNRMISEAAARNGAGVVRAAAIAARDGACSARARVSGFYPVRNPRWPAPVAYHPTQAGMDRVAAVLDKAIGQ